MNSVCGRGSTGRIVVSLHDALREWGDECLVVYGRGPNDPTVNALRVGTDASVRVHAGLSRVTDRQGFYSRRSGEQLVAAMQKFKPDIVHLHNLHGYYLNLPVLFTYLETAGIPVVWTLHDCWAFTGHCSHFDLVGCEKWRTQCEACPQKREYPASFVADNSRRNFTEKRKLFSAVPNMTIVSPSSWLADKVRGSFLSEFPLRVIHNGVDQAEFKPTLSTFRAIHQIEDKRVVLGVASPWSERKGLQDFVSLLPLLGRGYAIVLVGVDTAKAKELPSSFVILPRTDTTRELAAIYSAADVFFNPTYEDNYPTTNLEALSCGTPVVTYDTGGSPEPISRVSGAVVPKGDLDQAARQVIRFASHRVRVPPEPRFARSAMTKDYQDLYHELRP